MDYNCCAVHICTSGLIRKTLYHIYVKKQPTKAWQLASLFHLADISLEIQPKPAVSWMETIKMLILNISKKSNFCQKFFLYNSSEQLQFGRSIWFIIIKHCQSLVVEGYSILSYKQQSVQLNVLRSTKDKKIKDLNVKRPIFLLKILLNVP